MQEHLRERRVRDERAPARGALADERAGGDFGVRQHSVAVSAKLELLPAVAAIRPGLLVGDARQIRHAVVGTR